MAILRLFEPGPLQLYVRNPLLAFYLGGIIEYLFDFPFEKKARISKSEPIKVKS